MSLNEKLSKMGSELVQAEEEVMSNMIIHSIGKIIFRLSDYYLRCVELNVLIVI